MQSCCHVCGIGVNRLICFSGRSIVLDYLAQGVEERLSAQLVSCLAALGRQALVDGLFSHLGMIEAIVSGENVKIFCPGMYEALLVNILSINHILCFNLECSVHP